MIVYGVLWVLPRVQKSMALHFLVAVPGAIQMVMGFVWSSVMTMMS
jgi:hypothetical protein